MVSKSSQTLKRRYGEDYFSVIGSKGGSRKTGGSNITGNPGEAARLGSIGGKRSKKGYRFIREEKHLAIYQRISDGKIVEFTN